MSSLSLSRVPCLVRVSTRGSANSSERKTNTRTHLSAEGSRAIERGVHAAKRQEQRGWNKSERVNGSCGDAGQKKNSSFNPDLFPFLLPLRALSSLSLSLSFSRNTGTKQKRTHSENKPPPPSNPHSPRPSTLILAARGAPALALRCIALSLPSTLDASPLLLPPPPVPSAASERGFTT